MALPNQPWTTLYPTQQDTGANGEDQMPQLINDTFVGSDDGHRALAEHFLALRNKLDAVCKKVGDDSDLPAGSLADRVTLLEAVIPPPPHAASHEDGGADEINVGGLSGLLGDPQTPRIHSTSHEDGGADEINVGGLSGVLADPQTPNTHASTHENGGADEISIAGLSGVAADPQVPAAHASDHENGGADEISVTGLSGVLADPQTPAAHASTHEPGGSDEVTGVVPGAHAASHEDGGSDGLNVGGLSGVLADPQTPAAHAASHQDGGSDEVATVTPAAGAVPKADGSGKLAAGWIPSHATSHENGGADEISVAGLSGELADDQNAKAIRTTTGPTLLSVGAVADGEFLKRVGAAIVSSPPGTASPLTTKGDLYTYDTDNQRLPVGDGGQMLTPDPAEAAGVKWRNYPAFVEQTFQTLGTETPGDPVTLALAYEPFGTDRVDAPQEYDLLVFHEGTKMRYSASPSGGRDYGYNPTTKEVTVLATGSADQYEVVYRTLDDIVIAAILSTYGSASYGTDTYGPEAVVGTDEDTYGTAAYGTNTYGAETPYPDTYGTASYFSATYGAETPYPDTFGTAAYLSATYGADEVHEETFGSASFGSATFGSEP